MHHNPTLPALARGVLLLWLAMSNLVHRVEASELALNGPAAIARATAISRAIDGMTSKVRQCVAENSASRPELCFCKFPSELEVVKKAYAAALEADPTWRSRMITWLDAGTRTSHVLNMTAVERQLQTACP